MTIPQLENQKHIEVIIKKDINTVILKIYDYKEEEFNIEDLRVKLTQVQQDKDRISQEYLDRVNKITDLINIK